MKSGLPVDDLSNFISPICIIEASFSLVQDTRREKKKEKIEKMEGEKVLEEEIEEATEKLPSSSCSSS